MTVLNAWTISVLKKPKTGFSYRLIFRKIIITFEEIRHEKCHKMSSKPQSERQSHCPCKRIFKKHSGVEFNYKSRSA